MAVPQEKGKNANPREGSLGVYDPAGSSPISIDIKNNNWIVTTAGLTPASSFIFNLPGVLIGAQLWIFNTGEIDELTLDLDATDKVILPGGREETVSLVLHGEEGGGSFIHLIGRGNDWHFSGGGGKMGLTALEEVFWGTPPVGSVSYEWSGTTTAAAEAEIFLSGVSGNRLTLKADQAAMFAIRIMASNENTYNNKMWIVRGMLYRDNAGNTYIVGQPVYETIAQSYPEEYDAASGNNLGNGTIVAKNDISNAPSAGIVWINGDPYQYISKADNYTFTLSGTLTSSYSEDDLVVAGSGGWGVEVQADDTNEALVVKVTGQPPADDIVWKAVGTVDLQDIPSGA